MPAGGLTAKQSRFVEEYLVDMNATQAAIRAGYSEKTAHAQGPRLLENVEVRRALDVARNKISQRTEVTQDRVVNAIAQVAFGDIRGMFDADGRLKRPDEWDDETAAAVAGAEFVTVSAGEGAVEHVAKIKRSDRLKALDMLSRHLGLYNDTLNVNVNDGRAERLARAKTARQRANDG